MSQDGNIENSSSNGLGQQLIQARDKLGLSVSDVSEKLKFSVKQLTFLESEQFDQLSSPYFVRGMLRAYAKFLSLAEEPLLVELEKILPGAKVQTFNKQPVAITPQNISFSTASGDQNRFGFKLILLGLLLVVLVALILWFEKTIEHRHVAEGQSNSKDTLEQSSAASAPINAPGMNLKEEQKSPAETSVNVNIAAPQIPQPMSSDNALAQPSQANQGPTSSVSQSNTNQVGKPSTVITNSVNTHQDALSGAKNK